MADITQKSKNSRFSSDKDLKGLCKQAILGETKPSDLKSEIASLEKKLEGEKNPQRIPQARFNLDIKKTNLEYFRKCVATIPKIDRKEIEPKLPEDLHSGKTKVASSFCEKITGLNKKINDENVKNFIRCVKASDELLTKWQKSK